MKKKNTIIYLFILIHFTAFCQKGMAQLKRFFYSPLGGFTISGNLGLNPCATKDDQSMVFVPGGGSSVSETFLRMGRVNYHAEVNRMYTIYISGLGFGFRANLKNGDKIIGTSHKVSSSRFNPKLAISFSFNDLVRDSRLNYGAPLYLEIFSISSVKPIGEVTLPVIVTGAKLIDDGKILGYVSSPAIPYMILRKPPGDGSYTKFTTTDKVCYGFGMSTNVQSATGFDASVKVGVKVQAGFIVTTESEAYAQVETSLKMGIGKESNQETSLCFTTEQGLQTGDGDLYVMLAPEYAIGQSEEVILSCTGAVLKKQIALALTGKMEQRLISENQIIDFKIPELKNEIKKSTGSTKEKLQNQLDIWYQALEINRKAKASVFRPKSTTATSSKNEVKYDPPSLTYGSKLTYEVSQSSTSSRAETITAKFFMDNELATKAGFEVAGSGAEVGVSISFSMGGSNSATQSTEQTSSIQYHLEDKTEGDEFNISLYNDPMFGTPVFVVNDASQTSCPYEGGKKRFKPSLSFDGQTPTAELMVPEADRNGQEINLKVCNNSESGEDKAYVLQVPLATNAIITKGTYSLISSPSSIGAPTGIITAGKCEVLTIKVAPGSKNDKEYKDIKIRVVGDCGGQEIEEGASEVTLSIAFKDQSVPTSNQYNNRANLGQNYPNPFASQTHIPINLPRQTMDAEVRITTLLGQVIKVLKVEGNGATQLELNADDLARGTYFYSLFVDGKLETSKRMVINR